MPSFYDSAFHHVKCIIAFDDNMRIVAGECSAVPDTELLVKVVWGLSGVVDPVLLRLVTLGDTGMKVRAGDCF